MASFDDIEAGLTNRILALCAAAQAGNELEVGLSVGKPVSLKTYYRLLEHMAENKRGGAQVLRDISLDCSLQYDESEPSTYRATIQGIKAINDIVDASLADRKGYLVFASLAKAYAAQEDAQPRIALINKIKKKAGMIELPEYDSRIRFAQEKPIPKGDARDLLSLDTLDKSVVMFRYKIRTSLVLVDNEDLMLRLDVTDVKQRQRLAGLHDQASRYEVELDMSFKRATPKGRLQPQLGGLADHLQRVLRLLQDSPTVVTTSEKKVLLERLHVLAYGTDVDKFFDLPSMQAYPVDLNVLMNTLPSQYSVTDKADGEKTFLFIHGGRAFFINNNLEVRNVTEPWMNDLDAFGDTIVEGECIHVPAHKRLLFLGFDCLFFKGTDVRPVKQLRERLRHMGEVMHHVFGGKYDVSVYGGKYDQARIAAHYESGMRANMQATLAALRQPGRKVAVAGKYFVFPLGFSVQEVFAYATTMWNLYTKDPSFGCPYVLDGLIFTGIEQEYTLKAKEVRLRQHKWKPVENNSIDVFVRLRRDPRTNQVLQVYDNVLSTDTKPLSRDEDASNARKDFKLYVMAQLMVGSMRNGKEAPVPFVIDNEPQDAYIFVVNGHPRDVEGNIIKDETVVEFAYDTDLKLPMSYRWVPLRTRHDKTDVVQRFKRKYGNNVNVAHSNWQSIQQGITIHDIKRLSDPATYDNQMKTLRSRMVALRDAAVKSAAKKDAYYQVSNSVGSDLRQFHNWIKSNLIHTYCGVKTTRDGVAHGMDVLDLGAGRGGDLHKFYHARAKTVVGVDPDAGNLFIYAIERYNEFKKRYPGFTKMHFVVGDAGVPLNYEDQARAVGDPAKRTEAVMKSIFGATRSSGHDDFDIFNCQFMMHYLFKDDLALGHFCDNVNRHLRKSGYVVITTLDGDLVHSSWDDTGHINNSFTDRDGKTVLMYDLVRKYDYKAKDVERTGMAIDVHLPIFMTENTYYTEYLVSSKFLVRTMREKCGLKLVDTDSFYSFFHAHKAFFEDVAPYEENEETRGFFKKIAKFFDQSDDSNRKWFEYSRLNRFYVFKKV